MANPIAFTPRPSNPAEDLQRQLASAPREHAEELLILYDLLRVSHANGTLDLVRGLIGGRDVITDKLATYANTTEGVATIRNLLAAVRVLGSIDPEIVDQLSRSLSVATAEHRAEAKPPSLWQLAKRATSADARRGISFFTHLLAAVGKSTRGSSD